MTGPAELRRLARRYAQNPNLAVLLPDICEPTAARLAGDAHTDVWLVSSPEGTETGWHDHGGAVGALAVAAGEVVEETRSVGSVEHRTLAEGDIRSFGPGHVHNVVGIAPGRSLTIHVYTPRLAS